MRLRVKGISSIHSPLFYKVWTDRESESEHMNISDFLGNTYSIVEADSSGFRYPFIGAGMRYFFMLQ